MKFSEAIYLYEESTNIDVDPILKFGRPAERLTLKHHEFNLRQVALFLGDPPVEEVTQRHIVQLVRLMITLGWKLNAISPKLISLRKFFTHWRLHNVQVLDPLLVPKLKRDFNNPHVANPTHLKTLIDHIKERSEEKMARQSDKAGRWRHIRNLSLLLLLRDTGARVSEVLSLDLDQINTKQPIQNDNQIPTDEDLWSTVIKTEKSRGLVPFRQIFWKQETNDALRRWIETREVLIDRYKNDIKDTRAIFIGVSRYLHGTRLINSSVALLLRKYCRDLKIPTVNPHSLRHLFGHDTIKRYGSGADVMNLLGHATLSSSTTYTRMFGTELEERYRTLHTNRFQKGSKQYQPAAVPEFNPFGTLRPVGNNVPFKYSNYDRESQNP